MGKMWRNQNHGTSTDSPLDLDNLRAASSCYQNDSWKPPYVGRCVGQCDISRTKHQYPLSLVRPDCITITRSSFRPTPPELPYSKHTPPHWMECCNPEKYFKTGYTGNRFFTYPQFGHTSKVDTQSALCDFTNGYQFTKSAEFAPLPFYNASLDGETAGNEIYPRNTGLVPSYKGHVPGLQHSYGKTFGHESVNAKRYLNSSSICTH